MFSKIFSHLESSQEQLSSVPRCFPHQTCSSTAPDISSHFQPAAAQQSSHFYLLHHSEIFHFPRGNFPLVLSFLYFSMTWSRIPFQRSFCGTFSCYEVSNYHHMDQSCYHIHQARKELVLCITNLIEYYTLVKSGGIGFPSLVGSAS